VWTWNTVRLRSYRLSNVWATYRSILISFKKASRPRTFDTRQVFRVINLTLYRKDHHRQHGNEKCERKSYLSRTQSTVSDKTYWFFRPLPFLWWTRRREDLSEVLSSINWNSGCVNELKGRGNATWRCWGYGLCVGLGRIYYTFRNFDWGRQTHSPKICLLANKSQRTSGL